MNFARIKTTSRQQWCKAAFNVFKRLCIIKKSIESDSMDLYKKIIIEVERLSLRRHSLKHLHKKICLLLSFNHLIQG